MAKIMIESSKAGKSVAEAVLLDGPTDEIARLMLRAAASFIIQAREPEKPLLETCIAFGVSVYKMTVEMLQKGQTRPGVYIEKEDAK